jgi:hypothetical protein
MADLYPLERLKKYVYSKAKGRIAKEGKNSLCDDVLKETLIEKYKT